MSSSLRFIFSIIAPTMTHSQSCNAHNDCSGGTPFCYDGHCSPCHECHFCEDGIDGTCGLCGDHYPLYGPNCSPSSTESEEEEEEQDSAEMVVTENTCSATWRGALYSDYWGNGETARIHLYLTSPAMVTIKTCDSESDSFVSIRNVFGHLIDHYDSDNCGPGPVVGSRGFNEHLIIGFDAGAFTVEVGGHYSNDGVHEYSLEVLINECTPNEEEEKSHSESNGDTLSVVMAVTISIVGFFLCGAFIVGVAKWCKCCCFREREVLNPIVIDVEGVAATNQMQQAQIQMMGPKVVQPQTQFVHSHSQIAKQQHDVNPFVYVRPGPQ